MLNKLTYLVGSPEVILQLSEVSALVPFDEKVIAFLNDVSRELMKDPRSRAYSDVVTFAFWIRKSSVLKLKDRFEEKEGLRLGKGIIFHIAPSNVPVNFAYSLVSGLLCGNANVVRMPSKDFTQVGMITGALNRVLARHIGMKPYILCVRYDHDKQINDLFSLISDMRIIWGGDQTIAELRKSPLAPRSGEITFADRYSLAVIDSSSYMDIEDKGRVAEDFYNDTFLSDQNACTSPRIVVWSGDRIDEAKEVFWKKEHELVKKKYTYQPIQGVNKLAKIYLIATEQQVKVEPRQDNLIVRVKVDRITDTLMDYRDNSGYFYEYDCEDILDLIPICNDKHCQTIGYIGKPDVFFPLIKNGIRGIDRIVPIGKTMDFDLIWDGYDLPAVLTRMIVMA